MRKTTKPRTDTKTKTEQKKLRLVREIVRSQLDQVVGGGEDWPTGRCKCCD